MRTTSISIRQHQPRAWLLFNNNDTTPPFGLGLSAAAAAGATTTTHTMMIVLNLHTPPPHLISTISHSHHS